MRWKTWLGLTLSLTACRETVVLDQGPFDGSVGGIDGGPATCGPPVGLVPQSPKLMVALDRSDGMLTRFGDSNALAGARDVLDHYAKVYRNAIWFGYLDFPGPPNAGCSSQTCCIGSDFSPPTGSVDTFLEKLHACDQYCGVPTGYSQRPISLALATCESIFSFNQSDTVQRFVLLITNGRPDCGSGSGPGSSCGDGGETQIEIARLYGKNPSVTTYVVTPNQSGQFDSDSCFHDLAAAGGTQDNRSPHDAVDLANDIGGILGEVARNACELHLQENMQIKDSSRVQVTWMGMQVPHNNGWDVTDNGFAILLHGTWCDHLVADGQREFALYTSCPSQPRP